MTCEYIRKVPKRTLQLKSVVSDKLGMRSYKNCIFLFISSIASLYPGKLIL